PAAFRTCSRLTSLTLPNSVTTIGDSAFDGCSGLTSVTIPNSVTTIGKYAFYGCDGLTSVTISNSVTTIGDFAFAHCTDLTSITCLTITPPTCGSNCFYNVNKSIPVCVPVRSVDAYKQADGWKEFSNIQANLNEVYVYVVSDSNMDAIEGTGYYFKGETCTLTITPKYGYHFTQWSDGNTDNPRSFVVTKDSIFTAQFDKNTYTISTAVNDNQRGTVQGGSSTLYLDKITLTAIPNYGYHFTQWTDGNTDNPRKVVVNEDKTYTAQFDKNQYVVTVNKGEHIQSVVGAGTYEYMDEITLSVTAETHYCFDHWSDGNTDNPRSFVVTQDTTFTAISAKITSGKCGDNLRWNYNDDVLVISGTGTMYDYTQGTAPWMPMFKDSISSLVINNGCTSIGNFAFYGLSNKNLKTIDIPNSVEQIGQYAFANCEYVKNLYLGLSLEKISAKAFANDERLIYITCYAIEPPLLDESAFVNYDAYLSVPCESQADYKVSKGWKLFNKENISCIGAEETPIATDDVIVSPEDDKATLVWPADDQAAGYSIEISKDGVVFCTLKFNAHGQLIGIAFAPSRGGELRTMQAAEMTANGWQFTVTGLTPGSKYAYTVDVVNAQQQSIKQYTGEFTTTGGISTDWNQLTDSPVDRFTKIIKDNHLLIFRGDKMYNAAGVLMK
ncbi:MAG: leucine-rich repeat domain-containing protein, partial [Prevotellaceae bacterium]|nr:leucine-rich repeat domain-containing protein [Candidatus Colivivens equi]